MPVQATWNILLVDDDEDDYVLTKNLLSETRGRKTILEWAPTCADCLRCLETNRYDAILVDYDLGRCTGIALIRQVVATDYPAPLILLTGRGTYEIYVEAMQAGASMYLIKDEVTPLLLERTVAYAIERKRIERERAQILESIQDGFFAIDHDWQFTYVNRRAAENVGCQPADLLGKNIWEAFPGLLNTPIEEYYRAAMNERKVVNFEARGQIKDRWYAINVYPFEDGLSIYWQDITERKLADDALRQSEERFRTIFERSQIGIALGDSQGRVIESNTSLQAMLGYTKEELHMMPFSEFTHPEDAQLEMGLVQELFAGTRDYYEIEKRYFRKDGRMIRVRLLGSIIRSWLGEPVVGMVLVEDITSRKQAEEALRAKEATLRGILDATKESIWLFAPDGTILLANETAVARFNLPVEAMIGKGFSQFMSPELAQARQARIQQAVDSRQPVEFEDERAGIVFLHSFYPVFDDLGQVSSIAVFSRDITERKRLLGTLQQSQKPDPQPLI